MNERIKQLAEQAFFETEYDDAQNLPETMERFAELIVRECLSIADRRGAYNVMDDIIEHFGVEE